MAAVAAPAAKVAAAPVQAPDDLDTLKVGLLGSLKKGVNWQPPPVPPDENPLAIGKRGVADTRAADPLKKGKQVYANRLFTEYQIDQAGLKDAAGNPIVTIDQVPKQEKPARFYGKTAEDAVKTFDSFQTSLKDLRRSQFTKKLANKQGANKKVWNSLQKGLTAETQAELDAMTKIYAQKKDELQKRLQATFEEQKKQFLINRQHNTQGAVTQYIAEDPNRTPPKLAGPSGPRADVNLPGALERTGLNVIGSLPKARETRKRHRFIHLLVKPGTQADSSKPVAKPAEWYGNGDGNSQPQFPLEYSSDDENQSAAYKAMAPIIIPPSGEGQPPSPSETPPGSPLGTPTPTPTPHGGKRKTKRKPRRR